MEWNQIRYVCAVADLRSFSHAAENLFVTQPTLSQQIRKLEDELGYPLFVRSTRTVSLTEEGERFCEKATPLLAQFDTFQQEMLAQRKTQELTLNVGLLPTFLDFKMPDLIEGFQAKNPDITLSFEVRPSEELIKRLLGGKYDAVIAYITPAKMAGYESQLDIRILNHDYIHVAVSRKNPLSEQKTIYIDDVRKCSVIMLEKRSAIEREVQTMLQKYKIVPKKLKTSPAFRSMLGSVAMNQGICFLSSAVGSEYIRESVCSIPLSPEIEMLTVLIAPKVSPKAAAIERFREYILGC